MIGLGFLRECPQSRETTLFLLSLWRVVVRVGEERALACTTEAGPHVLDSE